MHTRLKHVPFPLLLHSCLLLFICDGSFRESSWTSALVSISVNCSDRVWTWPAAQSKARHLNSALRYEHVWPAVTVTWWRCVCVVCAVGCVCAQSRMDWERERRRTQVQAIKTLLAQANIRAKILQELNLSAGGSPHWHNHPKVKHTHTHTLRPSLTYKPAKHLTHTLWREAGLIFRGTLSSTGVWCLRCFRSAHTVALENHTFFLYCWRTFCLVHWFIFFTRTLKCVFLWSLSSYEMFLELPVSMKCRRRLDSCKLYYDVIIYLFVSHLSLFYS